VGHLEGLSELEPGEGRVVEFDGDTYALYKDDGGQVHALHNSCTHAKCTVHWNKAEKTWDCPCHGSRFGIKGNVLNAPAVRGLEQVPLHKDISDGLIL
jgi:Rieske Fe-S protein